MVHFHKWNIKRPQFMYVERPLEKIGQKVTNTISNINPNIFNLWAMHDMEAGKQIYFEPGYRQISIWKET